MHGNTKLKSILILSLNVCLGHTSGLIPHPNPVYTSCFPSKCPIHLILLDLMNRTIFGEEYRSLVSSSCCFLHLTVVNSTFLGPNILHSTLFSNTLSLCPSLSLSNQVSHSYKKTGSIVVTHPTMQCHLPHDLSPQHHHYENLNFPGE